MIDLQRRGQAGEDEVALTVVPGMDRFAVFSGIEDDDDLLLRALQDDWEEDIRMRLREAQFVKRLYNFVSALQSMGRVSPGPNNPDSNPNLSVQEKKDILIELLGL